MVEVDHQVYVVAHGFPDRAAFEQFTEVVQPRNSVARVGGGADPSRNRTFEFECDRASPHMLERQSWDWHRGTSLTTKWLCEGCGFERGSVGPVKSYNSNRLWLREPEALAAEAIELRDEGARDDLAAIMAAWDAAGVPLCVLLGVGSWGDSGRQVREWSRRLYRPSSMRRHIDIKRCRERAVLSALS
jgi:hypothetical protein